MSKIILLFNVYISILFFCFFCGCRNNSSAVVDINISIHPQKINYGDSFFVILSSNNNEYIPEIDLNNNYSYAKSIFVSSNNRRGFCVYIYKIKPTKKGVFIFKKSMISVYRLTPKFKDIPINMYFDNSNYVDVK